MMFLRTACTLGILLISAAPLYAEPVCEPTARIEARNYPGAAAIPTNNNLILPTGKSIESEGQKLILSARLLDKNCKPIPEAVVELWQANPFGKLELADGSDLATSSPTFAGAGRTITDSDGRFGFITAFPGVTGGWVETRDKHKKKRRYFAPRAPQLNIKIKAPDLPEFSTVLFFENDARNYEDPVYKKLSIERRRTVTMYTGGQEEDVNASIDLVLSGSARYRSY